MARLLMREWVIMIKAEYINPAVANNWSLEGDFCDPRVILVRKDDPRAFFVASHECFSFQGFDTPTYIAIGKGASDESLVKMHARYGVPLADLQEFRAVQTI